jgi:hypothetical protein
MAAAILSATESAPTLSVSGPPDSATLKQEAATHLSKFYSDHPNARSVPGSPERYIDGVFTTHKALIDRWGGWRFEYTSNEILPTLPDDIIHDVLSEVREEWQLGRRKSGKAVTPLQFRSYRTNPDELLYCRQFGCCVPTPDFCSPLWESRYWGGTGQTVDYASQCAVTIRRGQAVPSAVLADVRKRFAHVPSYVQFWETLFERLGVHWAGYRGLTIVLSCLPSDFLRLGTLGEDTCYRVGGENEHSKYNIALVPNSVVGFIYRKTQDVPCNKVAGRCWGVLAPGAHGAAFTNFYLLDQEHVLPGLQRAVGAALGLTEPIKQHTDDDELFGHLCDYAYVNDDGVSVTTGEECSTHDRVASEIQKAIGRFSIAGYSLGIGETCDDCHEFVDDGDAVHCAFCDDGLLCPDCVRRTACCNVCVCPSCRDEHVTNCEHCNQLVCADDCENAVRCSDRDTAYCAQCAAKYTVTCTECGNATANAEVCYLTQAAFCGDCASGKLATCHRCGEHVVRSVRTRCPKCERVRCDACLIPDEPNTTRSLCAECRGMV